MGISFHFCFFKYFFSLRKGTKKRIIEWMHTKSQNESKFFFDWINEDAWFIIKNVGRHHPFSPLSYFFLWYFRYKRQVSPCYDIIDHTLCIWREMFYLKFHDITNIHYSQYSSHIPWLYFKQKNQYGYCSLYGDFLSSA